MTRYRSYGQLDDPVVVDGDNGFVGINSYLEPTSLKQGFVQTSENMRLLGDEAEVRKGIDFLAGAVTLTYSAGTEQVFASTLFSDPAKRSFGTMRTIVVLILIIPVVKWLHQRTVRASCKHWKN